jgi:uncharacterized membrane protein
MMLPIKRSFIKRWMLAAALAMLLVASAPRSAMAEEDEPTVYDARIQGYDKNVQLDSGTTALTWVLLIVLTIVTLGVLFKDAKRTHLD